MEYAEDAIIVGISHDVLIKLDGLLLVTSEEVHLDISVTIKTKAGANGKIFGSVTSKDISEEIEKKYKIKLDKRWIDLKEGIKVVGTQDINIWLHPKVNAKVKVSVEAE